MESPNPQFGKNLLSDFIMEPNIRNINHGSFGSCPKQVMQAKRAFEEKMDAHTDRWYFITNQGFGLNAWDSLPRLEEWWQSL